MFMRMAWGRVEPGKWDEYEAAYRKGDAEAGRPDGLIAHRLMRDLDDPDIGYASLLWETSEAMEAYENSDNYRTRVAPIREFFKSAFVVNRLEVVVWEEFD
jgi:heme-degrading monooxygenase HmoA